MNESMILMAMRERARIKHGILRAANVCVYETAEKTRAKILFEPVEGLGVFFSGYAIADCRQIVRELTLEIIDELIEGLTETKKRIQAGGEI